MGQAVMVLGCALTLLAGLGVVRFRDVFARMHALTKASTMGILLVLLGAALCLTDFDDVTSLLLAAALQFLTMPVAANLIGRATYRASGIATQLDTVDELASSPYVDEAGPGSDGGAGSLPADG